MSIGQILAHAQHNGNLEPFSSSSIDKATLQSRIENVSKSKIFEQVPVHPCLQASPFLFDNFEFFWAYINLDQFDSPEKIFDKVSHHLNDCYWCFSIYSEVMRDYNLESEKINNFKGANYE